LNDSTPAGAVPHDVVAFWRDAGPEKWFRKDAAFDAAIRQRFGALHEAAAAGRLDGWAENPEGALALILLLDQFSRNLHRGSPLAFAQDVRARSVAERAIAAGFDLAVPADLRLFLYLPFEHSEAIADQERCVRLCHALPDRGLLPYARDHERIIRRFGRFPHRNAALGRHTTPAEQAFLDGGGFAG
jgi:uncharacterized protein (DUF924 family)